MTRPDRLPSTAASTAADGRTPGARRRLLWCAAAAAVGGTLPWRRAAAVAPAYPGGRVLVVGPHGERWRTLADAVHAAGDGDTIVLQPGDYRGDCAVVAQPRLAIVGLGSGAVFHADGRDAEGKAILVVRGVDVRIENCEFRGCKVPSRNGAGIRFESGRLAVRDCGFFDNEMGLLTSNDPLAQLAVESSEFARNHRPDGHNHNLYAGSIARLSVRGSHLHQATIGHLLKSRAAVNHIHYNQLVDGPAGSASYELEFPNGGTALVVGNVVAQGAASDNPIVVSYGAEGYRPDARHALLMVHNTLVDKMPKGGRFLRVMPAAADAAAPLFVRAVDNLLASSGDAGDLDAGNPAGGDYRHNARVDLADFADAEGDDYRLRAGTRLPLHAVDPGVYEGTPLQPTHEFAAPRGTVPLAAAPAWPGALQRRSPR